MRETKQAETTKEERGSEFVQEQTHRLSAKNLSKQDTRGQY